MWLCFYLKRLSMEPPSTIPCHCNMGFTRIVHGFVYILSKQLISVNSQKMFQTEVQSVNIVRQILCGQLDATVYNLLNKTNDHLDSISALTCSVNTLLSQVFTFSD